MLHGAHEALMTALTEGTWEPRADCEQSRNSLCLLLQKAVGEGQCRRGAEQRTWPPWGLDWGADVADGDKGPYLGHYRKVVATEFSVGLGWRR